MNACDVLRRHQHRQCRHERANSRYRTQYGGQTRRNKLVVFTMSLSNVNKETVCVN